MMCTCYYSWHFTSSGVSLRKRRTPQFDEKVNEHAAIIRQVREALAGKLGERNEPMLKPNLLKYAYEKAMEKGILVDRMSYRTMDHLICWFYENFRGMLEQTQDTGVELEVHGSDDLDIMDLADQGIDGEWEPDWSDDLDDWYVRGWSY
jgi:hypothetical protein